MAGRRSEAHAAQTHAAVLRRTAELASVQGLDGVSVGVLAADLGLSKAGVVGSFGTKQALQLEAVDLAVNLFTERVWTPVRHERAGIARLRAVCTSWADYAGDPPFHGGCLLVAASVEFDDKPGPVRDAVAAALRSWRAVLIADIETAKRDGDLAPDTDAQELAYTLEALAARTQPAMNLLGDTDAGALCARAMAQALRAVEVTATPPATGNRSRPPRRA